MVRNLISATIALFAVHALAYGLVSLLPDAATSALGLLGGNVAAVSAFWQSRQVLSYPDSLLHMLRGDFGLTIDQVPVSEELLRSLGYTFPILIAGLAVAALLTGIFVRSVRSEASIRTVAIFDFLNFIPPFFVPFFAAAIIFATRFAGDFALRTIAVGASIILPAFFMLTSMLLRLKNHEDVQRYPFALAANGVSERAVAAGTLRVAVLRLSAVFDRVVVIATLSIILAEPTLGLPGLGSLAARAVRTADPNLTIGVTVTIALITLSLGLIMSWLGRTYGGLVGRSP